MIDIEAERTLDNIAIQIDTADPISVSELSAFLAGVEGLYEIHPDVRLVERQALAYNLYKSKLPKLYITRLELGSVYLDIAPLVPVMGTILHWMDASLIVRDFANMLGTALTTFAKGTIDGAVEQALLKEFDLAENINTLLKPISGKSKIGLRVSHVRIKAVDGERSYEADYTFNSGEIASAASMATMIMDAHSSRRPLTLVAEGPPQELPAMTSKLHRECVLFLHQASSAPGRHKGKTVDKGIVPQISPNLLPVYFLSGTHDLKARMVKRDFNPLTNAFVVDLFVQCADGEPKNYVVTDIRSALPPGED